MVVYILWLLRGQDLYWERYWIGNLTIVFTSGLCAYAAWSTFKETDSKPKRKSWLWITRGLCLWFFLDSLNLLLFLGFQPEILLRIAQYLHLAGGLMIWFGLGSHPRTQRFVISKVSLFLDTALSMAAITLLLWDAWILPLYETHSIASIGNFVYILVDLISLVFILILFLLSKAEEINSALLWILFAILSFSVSDLNFVSFIGSDQKYTPGTTLDLGWVLGNMIILIAILLQSSFQNVQRPGFITRVLARSQSLLPIISILLLGWFAILNWQFNNRFDTYSLWGTLILGLGLLVSQGIQTGQNTMVQYAHLVNSIAEPAFVCDEHGKLRLINHAFLEISEYPRDFLINSKIEEMFVLQPPDQPWLEDLLEVSTSLNEMDSAREVALKTKTGALIPVLLTFRSIEAGNQQRLVYAATAHDLRVQKQQQDELLQAYIEVAHARTELEHLNQDLEKIVDNKTSDLQLAYQTLEEQNKTLQQLDQIKSDFVSLVSHELRAPLTNIRGGIELLLTSPDSQNEKTSNTLKLVQSEILRLSKFTETILDLSAMDANRLPLYPEPLDIYALTVSLQQFYAQTRGGERIKWLIQPGTPVVLADEKALHSILFHLLDNAIKYAPQGDILIDAFPDEEMVCIQVKDFGPGISDDAIPYIFDRFYRGNMTDSQTVYGHGLGLYMVKRFVETLNGKISAGHNQPSGSVFSVYLPMIK